MTKDGSRQDMQSLDQLGRLFRAYEKPFGLKGEAAKQAVE